MNNPYLVAIDSRVASKHLLQHPFYLGWTRGELSREALADYATQVVVDYILLGGHDLREAAGAFVFGDGRRDEQWQYRLGEPVVAMATVGQQQPS